LEEAFDIIILIYADFEFEHLISIHVVTKRWNETT